MPDFTPEGATPNPSNETLALMAYNLKMVPRGADVPHEWFPILRRQFIAASLAAADSAMERPRVDAWKAGYAVHRLVSQLDEFVLITIEGKQHQIPRAHAVYLHSLMACHLSPPRTGLGAGV